MTMKIRHIAVAIAFVAAAMPAGRAFAGPIGNTGSFNWTRVGGYHTGSGGEFTAYNLNGGISNADYASSSRNISNAQSFQTFCLEAGENAASPSYFVVAGSAARGGTTDSTDPLSKGTAWLYSEFAKGTLTVASGNYFSPGAPSRDVEAGRLQNAIWWLEGENSATTDTNYASNPYAAAVVTMFGGIAGAKGNATVGYLGVYVLNNFTSAAARDAWATNGTFDSSKKAQDFVYYSVPDGGTTLMLLGGALVGLGAVRRKFSA
jgi:hypothetical protein